MSEPQRPRKRRSGLILLLLALIVAVLLFLQFGGDFGWLDRLRDSGEPVAAADAVDAAATETAAEADAARQEAVRCSLRLDGQGLTADSRAVSIEEAIEACRATRQADLRVAGDATVGDLERTRAALREAGIEIFQN